MTDEQPHPARRDPTHVLVIEVPLDLGDGPPPDFDPVEDCLRVCLSVSRAAYTHRICDDVMASVHPR